MYRRWSMADHDALIARVLAALPGPGEQPQSTPELRERFPDLDAYARENYVRRSLDKLTDAGLVERVRVDDDTRAFWRRTAAGERSQGGGRRVALPAPR